MDELSLIKNKPGMMAEDWMSILSRAGACLLVVSGLSSEKEKSEFLLSTESNGKILLSQFPYPLNEEPRVSRFLQEE